MGYFLKFFLATEIDANHRTLCGQTGAVGVSEIDLNIDETDGKILSP